MQTNEANLFEEAEESPQLEGGEEDASERDEASDFIELKNLCLKVGAEPTLPMRFLLENASPPRGLADLARRLRAIVNVALSLEERAEAAADSAALLRRAFTSEERGRSSDILLRISLSLNPTCGAYRRAVERTLREVDGVALLYGELLVTLKRFDQGTEKTQQALLQQLGPVWKEMIQLAVCASDDQILEWPTRDAVAVINAIRSFYALVNYPSMSVDPPSDVFVERRPSGAFRVSEVSLSSFGNVALPLWDRIVRIASSAEVDMPERSFDPACVARQQAALWRHLEASCSSNDAAHLTPPKFRGFNHHRADVELEREGGQTASTLDAVHDGVNSSRLDAPMLQVVHGPIPRPGSREDVETIKPFELLAAEPMPVALMPDHARLNVILQTLSKEYPWANAVTDEIGRLLELRKFLGCCELMLPPLLLAGPAGTGKSRFARRLAQLLGVPFQCVALAGSNDVKMLTGTSRGWGGGCPTPLLAHMVQDRTASGLVLLDEVDKCANFGHGAPQLPSLLLNLLEPETSSRYRDGFLLTRCDLSRLMYVATANSLNIPAPLLSRFTVLYMPEPRPQDRLALANSMVGDMAHEMGVPRGAMPEVPAELAERFNGNARALRAALQRYLHTWAKENLARDRLH